MGYPFDRKFRSGKACHNVRLAKVMRSGVVYYVDYEQRHLLEWGASHAMP